jgi:hypothetical protein
MTQADSVLSTPPINTSVDPTRRRFLTVAAGASVASVGALTAAAMAPGIPAAVTIPPASPALRDAIRVLDGAHASLIAAQADNEEAEAMWTDWEAQNPQPASRKGQRRWFRRGADYHAKLTSPSWQALMKAEGVFAKAQTAVAAVPIVTVAELRTMATCSLKYDAVELVNHNEAPIAQRVASEVFGKGVQS